MGGSAVFEFKINKVLNLNEFIKLIRKAFKRKINQKDINKSEIFREFLSYHFLVDEGQVSIHLYHKENRLVLFLPPMIFNNLHYFVNIIKVVYNFCKVGAYGEDSESVSEQEYDLKNSKMKDLRIWSVNLFTQSEVQKYGRGKLLKAPCELIEEWEDDAIFMMIHKDRFSSTYEERRKLRKYLGEDNLPSNFQGKYLNGVYQ